MVPNSQQHLRVIIEDMEVCQQACNGVPKRNVMAEYVVHHPRCFRNKRTAYRSGDCANLPGAMVDIWCSSVSKVSVRLLWKYENHERTIKTQKATIDFTALGERQVLRLKAVGRETRVFKVTLVVEDAGSHAGDDKVEVPDKKLAKKGLLQNIMACVKGCVSPAPHLLATNPVTISEVISGCSPQLPHTGEASSSQVIPGSLRDGDGCASLILTAAGGEAMAVASTLATAAVVPSSAATASIESGVLSGGPECKVEEEEMLREARISVSVPIASAPSGRRSTDYSERSSVADGVVMIHSFPVGSLLSDPLYQDHEKMSQLGVTTARDVGSVMVGGQASGGDTGLKSKEGDDGRTTQSSGGDKGGDLHAHRVRFMPGQIMRQALLLESEAILSFCFSPECPAEETVKAAVVQQCLVLAELTKHDRRWSGAEADLQMMKNAVTKYFFKGEAVAGQPGWFLRSCTSLLGGPPQVLKVAAWCVYNAASLMNGQVLTELIDRGCREWSQAAMDKYAVFAKEHDLTLKELMEEKDCLFMVHELMMRAHFEERIAILETVCASLIPNAGDAISFRSCMSRLTPGVYVVGCQFHFVVLCLRPLTTSGTGGSSHIAGGGSYDGCAGGPPQAVDDGSVMVMDSLGSSLDRNCHHGLSMHFNCMEEFINFFMASHQLPSNWANYNTYKSLETCFVDINCIALWG